MSKVSITRSLLDDLAMSISAKSGEAVPLTLTEMKDAVDGISSTTVEALSVTNNGTYTAPTGKAYTPVTVNVSAPSPSLQSKTKSYTPTESAQTESVSADSGYDGLDTVSISVGAISNTYVGSGITRRSSTDLTASGATVTVPSGYYSAQASKSVASGTAGTPTASKGTVSNHSISVTPSVTNTAGYISGGTKTGTAVTVSASELVSGTKTITENGTGIDVSTYENVDVNVPSSEPNLGSLTVTPSASDQVFTGAYPAINLGVLSFQKTGKSASFSIDLSEIEYGETYHIQCDSMTVGNDGQYYNYIKIDTDWVASENGTVPFEYISHASWDVTSIKLSKSAITVAVSTGRSTIVNIGGTYTPTDFIVSKAGTVDGYNPVTVTGDANLVPENIRSGVSIFGITGTYTRGGGSPSLQTKSKTYAPTTSQQTESITADSGYDGLSAVNITVNAMPSGTAGTPTATKGTVSNHSISITPSVTNTTGYITGSTKTGTAVTVSASELVSGSETKTANGTYDVTNLASLVVNVPSGSSKNTQVVQGTTRTTSSTLTAIGAEMTVTKTGTYDVYWSAFRSSTSSSYTYGTQLYVGGTAYGTQNTTWSNHVQNNHLTGVSLTANEKIRVYGRNSRGSSYYIYAPTLVIVES